MQISIGLQESPLAISFPCIRVRQPIGEFYIGSIKSNELVKLTWVDVRRLEKEKRDFESYLGIQRPLDKKRVSEIQQYVKTADACFPSAVILAVPSICASYDEAGHIMTLSNSIGNENPEDNIILGQVCKVLDGQHRIEGLKDYKGDDFEVNVSLFVEMDIAEQAYVFSTVNLAQTKVNKSLVYDLYDLAKSRSPQKVCHNIAVAIDAHSKSPLHQRIKRLGTATQGRLNETITQSTFVEALLKYISPSPNVDRDVYLRGRKPSADGVDVQNKYFLRTMFLAEKDVELADIIWNYFDAVKERWPVAWEASGKGLMLNKTNGFKALMRFLRPAYLFLSGPGGVPSVKDFKKIFDRIGLEDKDFTIDRYKPGAGGESELYRDLLSLSKIKS